MTSERRKGLMYCMCKKTTNWPYWCMCNDEFG